MKEILLEDYIVDLEERIAATRAARGLLWLLLIPNFPALLSLYSRTRLSSYPIFLLL
jgi:hypothetical protein